MRRGWGLPFSAPCKQRGDAAVAAEEAGAPALLRQPNLLLPSPPPPQAEGDVEGVVRHLCLLTTVGAVTVGRVEIELSYDVQGPADAPAVLFVHGILTCRAHWLLNLEAFQRRYRTVVVELLGHGRSPAPEDPGAYHPDRYAEQFDAIRRLVGAQRWFVVGQSLGAALTLNYAMSHADDVIAHVVTNSHSAFSDGSRTRDPEAARARALQIAEGGIEAVMSHPLCPRRARALSAAARAQFDADMRRSIPIGIARTMLHTSPHTALRDRLPSNTVPSLLIAGDREQAFQPAREWVERHAANMRVVRVQAPHAVNIGAAAEFNAAALSFFSEFDSSAAAAPSA